MPQQDVPLTVEVFVSGDTRARARVPLPEGPIAEIPFDPSDAAEMALVASVVRRLTAPVTRVGVSVLAPATAARADVERDVAILSAFCAALEDVRPRSPAPPDASVGGV